MQSFQTLLIFFAALGVFVFVGSRRAAEAREAARRAAAALGLTFQDERAGIEGFAAGGEMPEMLKAAAPSAEAAARMRQGVSKPWVRKMLDLLAPWRIGGDYQGVKVSLTPQVRGSGKSAKQVLCFEAFFEEPLPFELRAARERAYHGIGKLTGLLQDIKTGNDDFDARVLVSGRPDGEVQAWLRSHERQHALLKLLEACPAAVVSQAGIALDEPRRQLEAEFLRCRMDALSAAVQGLAVR